MTKDEIINDLTQCLRSNDVSNCESCSLKDVDFTECRIKLRGAAIKLIKLSPEKFEYETQKVQFDGFKRNDIT